MSQPTKKKIVSDKSVDLTNQNRPVWLVKVPKYIADRWESGAGGTSVGKISFNPTPGGGDPEVMFKLSEEMSKERKAKKSSSSNNLSSANGNKKVSDFHAWSTTNQEIPSDYKLDFLKPVAVQSQHLAVLSQTTVATGKDKSEENDKEGPQSTDSTGVRKKLTLEGRVSRRAECKALHTTTSEVYMKVKREALLKPTITARKLKKINKLDVNVFKPVSNHAFNVAHTQKRKAEGRNFREDEHTVMEALFALFEKHQYYNIKDLVMATKQPVKYLKTILNEVCRYNVKPPHKNMWELKPEYTHYKKEEAEDKDGSQGQSPPMPPTPPPTPPPFPPTPPPTPPPSPPPTPPPSDSI